MKLDDNPRPDFRISRCCYTCKFFLIEAPGLFTGRCILPEGLRSGDRIKKLRARLDTFAKTQIGCTCENHQWKSPGRLGRIAKHAGIKLDDHSR